MRRERENKRVAERLRQAELFIDVQEQVIGVLGIPPVQIEDANNE